ncbi:hypothetical protein [Pedobacter cryophilus]|uniref:Uncharacterized protein n=1 Tax=Pedobacter cryophilus TaxID=2571271 RepID=A0A4V5NYS7_9SPHI|nr:hypothetical protein [Pedobacter cryophilus]TKB96970.1 hypothetical protein FA046_12940 [Pedobacter cryophilus]
MSIQELKDLLHQKIETANDQQLLETLNLIFSKNEQPFEIPNEHLKKLKNTLESDQTEYFTLNDFEEKYQKWLKD